MSGFTNRTAAPDNLNQAISKLQAYYKKTLFQHALQPATMIALLAA
jgi:hypothetical protein